MKKILCLILLSLCLVSYLSSCETSEQQSENSAFNNSQSEMSNKTDNEDVSDSEAGNENISEENVPVYADDKALFLATDRHDIEGDRGKGYLYNYKGDLIESTEEINMYYQSDIGLNPAADPKTGKVGFVDKDGVFQIDPIYDDASIFSKDGIALVKKELESWDEKCGYINSKGEEITPFIYDDATSFFDFGYAVACIEGEDYMTSNETHHILDTSGNVVVEILPEENMDILGLCQDYFVCMWQDTIFSFDYSKNKISEMKINQNQDLIKYDGIVYQLPSVEKDCLYVTTIRQIKEDNSLKYEFICNQKFVGKNFEEERRSYEIQSKRVSTTESGIGYGMVEGEETVIPFKYDSITECNGYFIAIRKKGNTESFDIYDKNYNLTAENIQYSFTDIIYGTLYYTRAINVDYGEFCSLPNGYFRIYTEDREGIAYGIVDYTGKIIVEPVYDDPIRVFEYRGLGKFDLLCM